MIPDQQIPVALHSIEELITALSIEKVSKYNEIIHRIDMSSDIFESHSSWSTESYTRNCLADNDKFELILICWQEGQITPIHNHGGEECWVRIIKGEFKETIYTEDEDGGLNVHKTIMSKADDVTYMIDFMGVHSIANLSNKKSMSLHLYAKPIRSCQIFDENSGKFVHKDLSYCTGPEVAAN